MSAGLQRWMWLVVGFALGMWLMGCAHAESPDIALESITITWMVEPCVTRCGLKSVDVKCSELQEVETRTLIAYEKYVKGWDVPTMCAALNGWDVRIHPFYSKTDLEECPFGGWVLMRDPHGNAWCAGGYTHVDTKSLEIDVGDLLTSSLAHEIGHALEFKLLDKVGHCGWKKRGLRKAIQEVTHRIEVGADVAEVIEDCPR